MAYTHILKVLRWNLQETCNLTQVRLLHTGRTSCPAWRLPVFRTLEAASGRSAPTCRPLAQPLRRLALDSTARSKSSPEQRDKSVSRYQGGSPRPSTAQKVKDAGRDFTYLMVVLIGLGVTGGLLYVVFQELFSSSSPNKIYGKAFNLIKTHPEVIGAFGEPIKCYGETTRRGRRQQVSHSEYMKDGLKHMRLRFYIEGSEPGLKGTVHSESKEDPETGKYVFRYIFVDVDTYPKRTIIVEDNR